MYEPTVQELPRTSTAIEGYHQHLQSAVLCHHPNIWRFLEVQEQGLVKVEIERMIAGHEPIPQCQQYRQFAERILGLVRDFAGSGTMKYLRAMALKLTF